jgi:tetratricopeptide (TPR) repeat protein
MEEPIAMRKMSKAVYLWPGLPQLWTRGSWSALGVALFAAALLNVAVVSSFAWEELIDERLRSTLWVLVAFFWLGAAIISALQLRRHAAPNELASSDDPFNQALNLYLKGDYYQVERLLHNILNKNIRDLEARLLLATMLRHTGRLEEAENQLDQLLHFEGAEKWELEIQQERELLTEAKNNLNNKHANGTAIAPIVESDENLHAA